MDATLPESDVFLGQERRRADRLIWAGLGRVPRINETPSIAVAFVSAGKQNFIRDYLDKRREYAAAGIGEYWVINRFARTMSVYRGEVDEITVTESDSYETELLPGFRLRLADLLAAADRWNAGQ